jgi:hypothetical protein
MLQVFPLDYRIDVPAFEVRLGGVLGVDSLAIYFPKIAKRSEPDMRPWF